MSQSDLQRTAQWYEDRRGKVSGTSVPRILGTITHKKTQDAIDLLALEKAIEDVYGLEPDDDKYISPDMKRGIELEPFAFKKFKNEMALKFVDVKDVGFVKYGKHAGSTSDGLCSNNKGLEIKCPRRVKFFKIVAGGAPVIDSVYYNQMQMQMLCNDTDGTYFVNYLVEHGVEYMNTILIHRDEERIALIKERLEIVIERKLKLIPKIKMS